MGQLGLQESKWVSQKKKVSKYVKKCTAAIKYFFMDLLLPCVHLEVVCQNRLFYRSFPFQNSKVDSAMNAWLGVVHKLRLQDKVGRWSSNLHFLSMFTPWKMST